MDIVDRLRKHALPDPLLCEAANEIERLRTAIAPLANCHLPRAGYEYLGVTAHFKTEQILAAKASCPVCGEDIMDDTDPE